MSDTAPKRPSPRAHGRAVRKPARSSAPTLGALYRLNPVERIALVKQGVPAAVVDRLSKDMAIGKTKLYATLGLAAATVNRKLRDAQLLSQDDSERVLGIARLIGQVEEMVHESGDPRGFRAAEWVAGWLDRPHPALGGRRPAELMDTAEGRALVSDLVARVQSSAYA
jgi:putative toxin-antitoxin system antitoxin component (TIGR02293 family)